MKTTMGPWRQRKKEKELWNGKITFSKRKKVLAAFSGN